MVGHPPLPVGTRVEINVDPAKVGEWLKDSPYFIARKMTGSGEVYCYHDSHGLFYKVKHDDDGTVGAYDPHELTEEAKATVVDETGANPTTTRE